MSEESRQGAVPGIVVHDSGAITIGTPTAIEYARLAMMLQAVKLEAHGIRAVRWSVTVQAKREYDIKGSREKVIKRLEQELEQLRVALNGKVH